MIEIHQYIDNHQSSNTVPDTSNINNEKQLNQNEPTTSENGNTTQPNNAQLTNPEQKLTQERKTNLENFNRIMNREKTTLPSLKETEWRTFKTETNKINQVQPNISTNNITELNELIYEGAK